MSFEMQIARPLTLEETLLNEFNLIELMKLAKQEDHPIFVVSTSVIKNQYRKLKNYLPTVKPHYAIKALPLQAVVDALHEEYGYFDVASNGEIDLLKKAGISPANVIHTHPIKRNSDIEYALAYGIQTFVVDNYAELEKFIPYKSKVRLLLRLSFRNSEAEIDLSSKFGLEPDDAVSFILRAKHLGILVDGISFHVGSNCSNSTRMLEALQVCHSIYQELETYEIKLARLDIGGGFPSRKEMNGEDELSFFEPIHHYLIRHFHEVEILSEPGRFIAAPSAILISKVIGKSIRNGLNCYYMNDGVYNNFSGLIFDKTNYALLTESSINGLQTETYPSVVYGPTCDSIDTLYDSISLPLLNVNDILIAAHIGAYSIASASNFNFLGQTILHIIND